MKEDGGRSTRSGRPSTPYRFRGFKEGPFKSAETLCVQLLHYLPLSKDIFTISVLYIKIIPGFLVRSLVNT